jgi:DNA-binding NarL/FixJ family response regulator
MKEANKIRILTVDDHHLFREGIAAVIGTQPDMLLIAQASNTKDAIERFRELKPDVTLMDLRVPDMGGINAMITIRAEFPDARVIILTTFSGDVEVQRALEAGARAYALKSMPPAELLEVIRQVHSGKRRIPPEVAANLAEHYSDEALSDREVEVLRKIGDGNRNRDIADKLFICEETVKVHIKHIMQKLNASDRTQAFAIGVRRGIIEL